MAGGTKGGGGVAGDWWKLALQGLSWIHRGDSEILLR